MTFMMFLSHGTQDLYPDFLGEVHKISAIGRANIAMIYNVGAVSERFCSAFCRKRLDGEKECSRRWRFHCW